MNRPKRTKRRDRRGASLVMVAAVCGVIVLVGLIVFVISELMGGSRELLNATDAGSLNLAKQAAMNPGVPLATSQEVSNFGDLVDTNGLVTLRTVNQVIGRALMIAINAQAEGTPEAAANAVTVLGLAQTNSDSICARLYSAMTPQTVGANAFLSTAMANSSRMLGGQGSVSYVPGQYQTAYMNAGAASNVFFPAGTPASVLSLLPSSAFSTQKNAAGQPYLVGYQPITITVGGNTLSYCFVPLQPGGQPHLVSGRDFAAGATSPLPGLVPPNSFQSGSSKQNQVGSSNTATAFSLVSSMQYQAQLDFPRGYVTVTNPPGMGGVANANSFLDSLFTNELAAGIYLANNASGQPVGFTTDSSAVSAWASYNKNPTGKPPSLTDGSGNPIMYDLQGNPATQAELSQIKSPGSPSGGCNTLNVGGNPPASTTCNQMLGSFEAAFPHAVQTQTGNSTQVMAIEYWGEQVFAAGGQAIANAAAAGVPQSIFDAPTTSMCIDVTPTSVVTGLELFDRAPPVNTVFNSNTGGNIQTTDQDFGLNITPTAGTPTQLGDQVNAADWTSVIEPPLFARIRQIKPEASDAEIAAVLNTPNNGQGTLLLGSVHYICMPNQQTRVLVMTSTKPRSLVTGSVPDGPTITITSGPYETIGYTVDNWFSVPSEVNGYCIAFQLPMSPSTTGLATDRATWQPSTGFNNCLGNLEFYNSVAGAGTMCGPN